MSRLFGYDFCFKNRTPRFPFGNRFGRHPYRNSYRLIASLILIVYMLISQNDMVKNFNNAIRTAMIESGEISDEQLSAENPTDVNDKFIKQISGLGFRDVLKNNSKIVIYKKGNSIIEAYKNSPDWNTKFKFVEFSSTRGKSNRVFKTYCGEICIIDMQNKKHIAIPEDKSTDGKYIYDTLGKLYY